MNNQPLKTDSELEEYHIRLLEEKLKIDRTKHKIGEVIIRKEIETHIVEIPVRSEKLIVEQIGAETIRLAEVELSRETVTGVDLNPANPTNPTNQTNPANPSTTVEGKFSSLEQAVETLAMIARQQPHGCTQVQVKVFLEDPQFQQTYQMLFQQSGAI